MRDAGPNCGLPSRQGCPSTWALKTALDPVAASDASRPEQQLGSRPEGIGLDRWEDPRERIGLPAAHFEAERVESFGRHLDRWRECVAFMLNVQTDL